MKYISFVFFKEYYYFIVFWILSIVCSIITHFFQKQINYEEKKYIKEYNTIELICLTIGDLLGGFLVLYTYYSSKPEKTEKLEEKKNTNNTPNSYILIYNDLSIKKYKYRLIFLISILHFICIGSDFIFFLIFNDQKILKIDQIEWLIPIEILARIIFCKYILEIKLYKHHEISIIMCIIGFIFFGIIGLIKVIKSDTINKWYYLLFTVISEIVISLEDVICKILLTEKFVLPHILMFWRGIIISGILTILIPILQSTEIITLQSYFNSIGKYIFLKLIIIIFSFFKSFITMKVIYIFTPQHVAFLTVVFSLYDYLNCIIDNEDDDILDIFDMLLILIIIISILIFNEMIIINCCGLNENTKKGLLIKEKNDESTELNSTVISYNDEERKESCISDKDIANSFNSKKSISDI